METHSHYAKGPTMSRDLIDAIVEMREQDALKITDDLLAAGADPLQVLDACKESMEIVGKRYEEGLCFVPELILAGEMLKEISEKLKPLLTEAVESKKHGKVIIGTVEGDIHDIGKDIVTFMLDVNGFDVLDLGVDVPAAKFVEAAQEFQPDVVGLSGFLTLAYDPMKATITALKDAGFTHVKYMIGGGQIDNQICEYTGADAVGNDAVAAVSLAKQWV
jgi:methanogenic corrinoid protein MtbC1